MAVRTPNYRIMLQPHEHDGECEWIAEIPELPGTMGVGSSIDEALVELERSKDSWLSLAIEDGEDIPEPIPSEFEYSGKFTLRLPRTLHRQLALQAAAEGLSLNQYVLYLLSRSEKGKTVSVVIHGTGSLSNIEDPSPEVLWGNRRDEQEVALRWSRPGTRH